ncbi:MAG: hypothetical protein WCP09_01470 [Candidatus Taylorbacteria bacterium]
MAENNKKETNNPEVEKGFDIDKALNTKGFAEFLAKKGERKAVDVNKENVMEETFEVFEVKQEVLKGIKELFKNEIQADMGVKLEAKDLDSIDTYIDGMAIDKPNEIVKLKDKIEKMKELPKQIAEYESQLKALGNFEDLNGVLSKKLATREQFRVADKYSGVLGKSEYVFAHLKLAFKGAVHFKETMKIKFNPGFEPSQEYLEYVTELQTLKKEKIDMKAVEKNLGSMDKNKIKSVLSSVESDIKETEAMLDAITNLEMLKATVEKSFTQLKKKVFGGISDIKEINEVVQTKALQQLKEMVTGGTVDSLKNAQSKFEKLLAAQEGSTTGIDPFEGKDAEKMQEAIDITLQKKASEKIMETVNSATLGNNALTKMEKVLQPFLAETKLGSLDNDETKEFIIKSIEEVSSNLGDSIEDKGKKLLLARILAKAQV